jgi:hypothetical protein
MERRDEPHPDDSSRDPRDRTKSPAEEVARDPEGKAPQLAGGVVGAGAGLSMGMAAGPIGMVLGALAGAAGGWWATDRITEEMKAYPEDEDRRYREHYELPESRLADVAYEDARPAYLFGHLAARNPAYGERKFADVEGELERDWNAALAVPYGEWARARRYTRVAFERCAGRGDGGAPRGDA